jgi:hypothetical protein
MQDRWEKPDFQCVEVNGECTAYAGAKTDWPANATGGAPATSVVVALAAGATAPGERGAGCS